MEESIPDLRDISSQGVIDRGMSYKRARERREWHTFNRSYKKLNFQRIYTSQRPTFIRSS